MKKVNKETKRRIDLIIKIILIIIIILLLIHNCKLAKDNNYMNNVPNGNVDIIDIKCDNNKCVPVKKNIENLSFAQSKVSIKKDDTLALVVTITPSELSSSKLIWKSSNTGIVSVDSNGVIKGVSIGTATITVKSSNGKIATCTVTVTKDSVEVKKINLTPDKSVIEVGALTQISATVEPKNATNRELVWTSSDTSVATVDNKGLVKGIKGGTVTITAKTKNGKVVASTTIKIETEPKKEIKSLSFAQSKVNIKKDDILPLVVTITPSELLSSKLIWESSNPSVVSIDSNGVIKGVNIGTATITVKSSNGKTAKCTVEVTENMVEVKEIILTPNEPAIYPNSTTQVAAVVKPENATNRELVWTSSDPSVATVDNKGIVKGIKSGTVTITAKTKDGKVVTTTTITVQEYEDELEVYDNDHTSITWNGSNDLKIFSKSLYNIDGVIAPESENTYEFIVRNSTRYDIKYNIKFIETNANHINMKYKLRKNDVYLVDQYSSFDKLNLEDQLLSSKEKDTFYLEWKWISSSNDTNIGKNPEAKYGLKIQIEAENIHG